MIPRTLIVLAAVPAAALAQSYTVAPIDPDPGITSSFATCVSPGGLVGGHASIEGGRRQVGFVWRDSSVVQTVVPQAGDFGSRPRALDIQHQVAVFAVTDTGLYGGSGSNVNFGHSAQPYFSWIPSADPYPSEFIACENLGNALVLALADAGPTAFAAGAATPSGNIRQGFISVISRTDDVGFPARVTVLPGFGGPSSFSAVYGVNSAGDAVGYSADAAGYRRPFLRPFATGVMVDLGTLGGPSGEALAISGSGYVVGAADVAPGRPHAFLRAPGGAGLVDLGTLGGPASAARAVNNAGEAVGESWTGAGEPHATLWSHGRIIDLNSAIPAASGWLLTAASGISDGGRIAGWGRFQGRTLAYVLEPAGCAGDFNGSGAVTVQDIFDFLAAYFTGSPGADVNHSGSVTVQDIFDYLVLYFAGC